jgi:N-hydroxyarylamine O-acetyltransferase
LGEAAPGAGQLTIDLDAYCRRIGYSGARVPTLDTLRAIHRLHPQAIAFENLDPLLKRPVRLDAASLQRKLVHSGRGGYCYEQNILFGHALRAIGFKVKELAGRVLWNLPEGTVTPRVHMLLLIALEGQSYVADVGFGNNTLTGPLVLISGLEQSTPHEPFQLIEVGDEFIAQVKIRDGWAKLYRFDLEEQLLSDLELGNWYMSTHPDSRFVCELVAARAEPDRRYALCNNELAVHRLNGKTERRVLRTVPELRDVLTDVFRLTLPDVSEFDTVLARFTNGAAP